MTLPSYLRPLPGGGCALEVWVQPGASRDQLAGRHGERLKIKLSAPPQEGRANRALVSFLAELLQISASAIELVSGKTGRAKSLRLALSPQEAWRRLEGA